MFFLQLRNEIWKLFGKKRTYIGFGMFLIAQNIIIVVHRLPRVRHQISQLLEHNGFMVERYISVLTISTLMVSLMALTLMPLYTALVGGDLVAKEAEDGTLRMILSRPISRLRLLFVKWSAGIIFAVALVLALGLTAMGFASLLFPWKGMFVFAPGQAFSVLTAHEGLMRFIFSLLFMAVNASVMVSVAFMFSCFNMKPAAATILALSFLFVSMVMENIPFFDRYENWFVTHHFKCWLLIFLDPAPWTQICQSEIILFAMSATAFIIGAMAFSVRDIKS